MNGADNKEHLQQLIGDDYQLQWIIGHGGMSTVWLADDPAHDREVAIKVLRPEFSDNNEFLSRFRNEAKAAESIDSENVVATYDYREVEDPYGGVTFCFMVLEYVRGESLADLLARESRLPEALALDVMEQAAHGLSIIHRMNLVHRDIKPGNLLITQNGQVKITDFGIAKAAAAVPLTRTGMVVGTAQYVSPEQAQGRPVTPASDVYSLGVVGYEMLAGERPFTGDSSVSVALAHISQNPEPLSTNISAPVRELVGITLRKDPATRYADGNELALAVSAVRLGKRPPAPKSAAVAGIAPEPSPTAATQALGNATNPTTIHPAAPWADPQTATPTGSPARAKSGAPATQRPKAKKESNAGRNIGMGLLIVAGAAALVGGGFFAANMFSGSGGSSKETTSTTPTIVTQWVSPTEDTTEQETTTAQQPMVTTHRETQTITTVEQPTSERPEPTSQQPTEAVPTTTNRNPGGIVSPVSPGGNNGTQPSTGAGRATEHPGEETTVDSQGLGERPTNVDLGGV